MIGGLRDVRTQLLVVVGLLLLLDLAAIALLISPAGRSRGARQKAYEQLRLEKVEKAKSRCSGPGHGPEDCDRSRTAGRLHPRADGGALLGNVGTTITHRKRRRGERHRCKIRRAARRKDTPPGYDSVGITIQVRGSYDQDMHFINAVERQKMLLLIDAVTFGGMQGDALTVSVHLSTFLRSAA